MWGVSPTLFMVLSIFLENMEGGDDVDYDGRNYIRNTFLALAKLNKPFIIKGTYFAHPYQDYITYKNIRPYTSRTAKTNQICDHINVMEEDVRKYLAIDPKANGRTDILVCRAMEYQGKDGSWRGGIFLTEELGIPPVINETYQEAREMVSSIPKDKGVDFFTFAEGRYAFYGMNLWETGHKIKPEPPQKPPKRKKKKRNRANRQPAEVSFDDFMMMHKQANPIWIPPPRDMRRIDMNTWLKIAVPQIELRKILEKQPSLKKEVLQAFLNKS